MPWHPARDSSSTGGALRKAAPLLAILSLSLGGARAGTLPDELYSSSVTGTEFDFIVESDPSLFLTLEDAGEGEQELPDKASDAELMQQAISFVARFEDNTSVALHLDAGFGSRDAARTEALRYVHPLGKLPTSLRRGVERVVIHQSDEPTTAFSDIGLIVVYSANATVRIANHDLEETVFHESVHASWDREHASSAGWIAAQESDGDFVTRYAAKNPAGEDLAESALFAYTLVHHPERIPEPDASAIRAAIPARIAFVEQLLPAGEPVHFPIIPDECRRRISTPGSLSDILSNAMNRTLDLPERDVRAFLAGASSRYASSDEMLRLASEQFEVPRARLHEAVLGFLHVNCDHPTGPAGEEASRVAAEFLGSLPDAPRSPEPTPTAREAVSAPDANPEPTGLTRLLRISIGIGIANLLALVYLISRTRLSPPA